MRPNRAGQTSRRQFLAGAAAGGVAPALVGSVALARGAENALSAGPASYARQDEAAVVGEANSPTWTIRVFTFADPYEGQIVFPTEQAEGTRYAGAEVEIVNDSDAPLVVGAAQLRLRTSDKQEFTANAVGSEPRVFDINMRPGERTRGWVWFTLPDGAEASELLYNPPAPLLRIALTSSDE